MRRYSLLHTCVVVTPHFLLQETYCKLSFIHVLWQLNATNTSYYMRLPDTQTTLCTSLLPPTQAFALATHSFYAPRPHTTCYNDDTYKRICEHFLLVAFHTRVFAVNY